MTTIRTAICVEAGEVERGVRALFSGEGDYEVVGCVDDVEALVEICETQCPDLVVLDDRLSRGQHEAVLLRAGLGTPMPALLLVDVEARLPPAQRAYERRTRLSRVDRNMVIRTDDLARAHARTRLALAAARLGRSRIKRTQSAIAVQHAKAELEQRAKGARMRDEVVQLSSAPLDLIALVGGPGRLPMTLEVVARLTAVPVPLLVALDEPGRDVGAAVAAIAQFDAIALESTLPLRAAHGLLSVVAGLETEVEDDAILVRPAMTGGGFRLGSMAALGQGGLTVLVGGDGARPLPGARDIARAGGLIAALTDPSTGASGSALAEDANLIDVELDVDELSWLTSRAVPRRA